jgi:hypothetical protein
MMNTSQTFPAFDDCFPELNGFILGLVQAYEAGKLRSWDDLKEKADAFFTPQKMEEMESLAVGWQKMSSYRNRVTLTHVMGVFLGLFMLPEFRNLSKKQQQLAKWIVLFHDLEKEFAIGAGERDKTHAFRSAVAAASQLPQLGFGVSSEYEHLIHSWSHLTSAAIRSSAEPSVNIQDNRKLPEVLTGIERMFGEDTPSALIVKTVLLHMSITVLTDWPQAAPLTEAEIQKYVNGNLFPLVRVMMLADNEGWVMFDPTERSKQRNETLAVFHRIEQLISKRAGLKA